MNHDDFFKSIESGQFLRAYLFTGPEELIKREALAALRKALLPAGLEALNDATLEACSAQAIIDSAETMPVMCERRIVVVRDWPPLTSAKLKNEEADAARIVEWLQSAPDSCVVVFYLSATAELDARKKLSKALRDARCEVVFDLLSGAALQKWCNQQLKPFGKKLRSDAMDALGMMAGSELTRLSGELTKLAAYVEDSPEITVADVKAVVTPSTEYSIFEILDHLLRGDLAEATRIFNLVWQSDPYPDRILSLMSGQLRIDAHMKALLESGKNTAQFLKEQKISPYRAKHIERQIRPHSAKSLQERYLACVETEFALRSGELRRRAAFDALMLRLLVVNRATK